MSASADPHVLLIGGPDAGKSNFLFRFWLAVDSGHCALIKDGFPDELQYLQTGSETILSGKFAGRTSGDVLEHATIPLKLAANASYRGVLTVPDLPGEQVLEVYRLRQWTDPWESRIGASTGCLVFLRAGSPEVVASLDYDTCLREFGGPLPVHVAESTPSPAEAVTVNGIGPKAPQVAAVEATPGVEDLPMTVNGVGGEPNMSPDQHTKDETPTEIVLTEWLQFLRAAFTSKLGGSFRPRIGIVVAAWDALPLEQRESLLPAQYIAQEYPLLSQVIETNGDEFDFQVFGVSIVSGDLTEDRDFRERFVAGQPQEFGYVIHTLAGNKKRVPDMTLPVTWALGWTDVPAES